jgi:hypothetical protein
MCRTFIQQHNQILNYLQYCTIYRDHISRAEHGKELFAEIESKCTMNLSLVGFHVEMENLGTWPPILLLVVAVDHGPPSMSPQKGSN